MKTAEIMLEGNQKNSRRHGQQEDRKHRKTGEQPRKDFSCILVPFLCSCLDFCSDGGSGETGQQDAFGAGGFSTEELDAGAREGEGVGEEFDEGGVGGAVDGGGAEADFEGVAVFALDGVFGGARDDAQGKDCAVGGVGQEGHDPFLTIKNEE